MTPKQRRECKVANLKHAAARQLLCSLPNPNSKTQRRLRCERLHDEWRAAVGIGPVHRFNGRIEFDEAEYDRALEAAANSGSKQT
jgi:hypothetical protein